MGCSYNQNSGNKMKPTVKKQIWYLTIAWLIISVLIALGMKAVMFLEDEEALSNKIIIAYFFAEVFIGVLIIAVFIVPIFNIINTQKSRYFKIVLFSVHGLIFSVIWIAIFTALREFFIHQRISEGFTSLFLEQLIGSFHHAARTYLIFISILLALDYFHVNTYEILRRKDLENEVNIVKLDALKAQLQPHFLFNALNNIVALMDENKKRAQEVLIDLSDILRFTIRLQPDRLVYVEEELKILKKYTGIEKSKYEDKLIFDWQIEEELNGLKLPPLIIQPLVENAIKHGFVDNEGVLHIIIRVNENKVEVLNNGTKLVQPKFEKGHGISIVENRLSAHYGDNYSYKLFQKDGWVVNKIVLN